MISNFFEITFETPRLPVFSGAFCLSDYHCFNNGKCLIEGGQLPICQCYPGYSGLYCQTRVDELSLSVFLSNLTLSKID